MMMRPGAGVVGLCITLTLLVTETQQRYVKVRRPTIPLSEGYKPVICLVGGELMNSGSVTLTYMAPGKPNITGLVCDDGWNYWDGQVVCRSLGFTGVSKWYGSNRNHFNYANRAMRFLADDVKCYGTETDITRCRNSTILDCRNDQRKQEIAGVTCIPKECPTSVRLVDSPANEPGSGTVELTHNCTTGYICDRWWDKRDANVVCRMLGYMGAHASTNRNFYKTSMGNRSIVLDQTHCRSGESKVTDCRTRPFGRHHPVCDESRLAGVRCKEYPSGWIAYSSNRLYYQVFDQPLSYQAASRKCKRLGGTLPTPRNYDENDFVASLTKKNFWLGIKRKDAYDWMYEDGDKEQWTNWGNGQPSQPNNDKTNNFVYVNMTSQMDFHHHDVTPNSDNRLRHGLDQKWGATNSNYRAANVRVTVCQKGCQIGWEFDMASNTCYRIHNKQEPFYEAKTHCQDQCGELPMPKTEEQNKFFAKLTNNSFWLGMWRRPEGAWSWWDGEMVTWSNWDQKVPAQPDGGEREKCAVMKAGEGTTWADVACEGQDMDVSGNIVCTYKRRKVCLPGQYGDCCEKDCDCRNSTDTCDRWTGECPSGKKWCPRGWHYIAHSKRCYRYFNETVDYFEARKKCNDLDGISALAMPKTEEIHARLVKISQPSGRGWIGLDDWHQEGEFIWDDGEELEGWVKWLLKTEEMETGRGHCVTINNNLWKDRSCHMPQPGYFCEIAPFEEWTCSDATSYKDLDGQVWTSCKDFLSSKGSYLCVSNRVRRACCASCKNLQLPGPSKTIEYDPQYTDHYTFDLLVVVDHKNVQRFQKDYKEEYDYDLSEKAARFMLQHYIQDNTLVYAKKGFARYNITMKVAGYIQLDHNFVSLTGWKAGVSIQIPPFREWMIENGIWEKYKYDVVMFYSGFEPVIASGWSSTTLCRREKSWSLVGGYTGLNQNYLTMHELGHNLGASHTGLGWMGRWMGHEYFTPENMMNIRKTMRYHWNGTADIENGYNRTPWSNCIRKTNPDQVVLKTNDNLSALEKMPDVLCANLYGNTSYMCRLPRFYEGLPATGDQLCGNLHCVVGDFHWECHRLADVETATEGMACATGKSCQGGKCKPDTNNVFSLIQVENDNCPYGDQHHVTDIQLGHKSCSDVISLYGDAVCAGDFPFEGFKYVCCASCKQPQENATCVPEDGVFPKPDGTQVTCDEYLGSPDDEDNACQCFKEDFRTFCCNACNRRKMPETKIRLVGGTERSGTVEVTHQCITGIVCDNNWGIGDGDVACRMLGFSGALQVFNNNKNHFNYSNTTAEFLFDEVACSESDTNLAHCRNRGFRQHKCRNNKRVSEAAGVECSPKECETAVRLVGGEDARSGTVLLDYKCETGVICDDMWDLKDGDVVCRMMGFPGAEQVFPRNHFNYANHSSLFLLDDVRCVGNEPDLTHCGHFGFKKNDCSNTHHKSEVAGVRCKAKET